MVMKPGNGPSGLGVKPKYHMAVVLSGCLPDGDSILSGVSKQGASMHTMVRVSLYRPV